VGAGYALLALGIGVGVALTEVVRRSLGSAGKLHGPKLGTARAARLLREIIMTGPPSHSGWRFPRRISMTVERATDLMASPGLTLVSTMVFVGYATAWCRSCCVMTGGISSGLRAAESAGTNASEPLTASTPRFDTVVVLAGSVSLTSEP